MVVGRNCEQPSYVRRVCACTRGTLYVRGIRAAFYEWNIQSVMRLEHATNARLTGLLSTRSFILLIPIPDLEDRKPQRPSYTCYFHLECLLSTLATDAFSDTFCSFFTLLTHFRKPPRLLEIYALYKQCEWKFKEVVFSILLLIISSLFEILLTYNFWNLFLLSLPGSTYQKVFFEYQLAFSSLNVFNYEIYKL